MKRILLLLIIGILCISVVNAISFSKPYVTDLKYYRNGDMLNISWNNNNSYVTIKGYLFNKWDKETYTFEEAGGFGVTYDYWMNYNTGTSLKWGGKVNISNAPQIVKNNGYTVVFQIVDLSEDVSYTKENGALVFNNYIKMYWRDNDNPSNKFQIYNKTTVYLTDNGSLFFDSIVYDPQITTDIISTACDAPNICNNVVYRGDDGITLRQNDTNISFFWEFEETSGTTIFDSSGNDVQNINTENGPILNNSGYYGSGINFTADGDDERIRMEMTNTFGEGGPNQHFNCSEEEKIFMSAWVYIPNVELQVIIAEPGNGGPFRYQYQGSSHYISISYNGGSDSSPTLTGIQNKTWNHFVWTYHFNSSNKAKTSDFYWNGVLVEKGDSTNNNLSVWNWADMNNDWFLGADQYGNDDMDGGERFDNLKYGCMYVEQDWVKNEYNNSNMFRRGNFTTNFTFTDLNNMANLSFTCENNDTDTSCCAIISGDNNNCYPSSTNNIDLQSFKFNRNVTIILNTSTANETPILKNLTLSTWSTNDYPTAPNNITCDGGTCNSTFSGSVEINCSGATDPENGPLNYTIYVENNTNTTVIGDNGTFETNTNDWLAYNDTFNGTSEGAYTQVRRVTSIHCTEGSCLAVYLNENEVSSRGPFSGGWNKSFVFGNETGDYLVSFDYKVCNEADTEDGEDVIGYYFSVNDTAKAEQKEFNRSEGDSGTAQGGPLECMNNTFSEVVHLTNGETYEWLFGCYGTQVSINEHYECYFDNVYINTSYKQLNYNYTNIANHTNGTIATWDTSPYVGEIFEKIVCSAKDNISQSSLNLTLDSNLTITSAVGDTCDCSSIQAGNPIDCSENCDIDTCNANNQKLRFINAGTVYVLGAIYNYQKPIGISGGCVPEIYIGNGGIIR